MLPRSLIMTSGLCANAEQPSAFTDHSVHWQNSCVLLVSTNHAWLIGQCTSWLVSANVFPQYTTWPHTVVSWAHTLIGGHTCIWLFGQWHPHMAIWSVHTLIGDSTWLLSEFTPWLVITHGSSVSVHALQLVTTPGNHKFHSCERWIKRSW